MPSAEEDGQLHCMIPLVACIRRGDEQPTSVQNGGVKMCCTNTKCQFARQLVHNDCFEQLENTLIKIISNLGSARGWTDLQRRNNLWEKKGLTLIQKNLRCHCGLGLMTRDVNFYKELDENGTSTPAEVKGRKKKKKKLPKLNYGNNSVVAVADNTEIYKKKFSDPDAYYRDDSLEDRSMSVSSTENTSMAWHKGYSVLFDTPKRSDQPMKLSILAQSKYYQFGSNSVQPSVPPPLSKSDSAVTPVLVWKTVPSAAPIPVITPMKKFGGATPPQLAAPANVHRHLPTNNETESAPEITPPDVNGCQKASTPTLPHASWTSIVQSSLTSETAEAPCIGLVDDSDIKEREPQQHHQREYAVNIAGQCGSIAGNTRNMLVYTLFGNNAPNFLLGERIMADHYLPKQPFC